MNSVEPRLSVLILASGARWEAETLAALAAAGIVVLRRCVDAADLMAGASSGLVSVAILDQDCPGLDREVVSFLREHGVRSVAVGLDGSERLQRIGVESIVAGDPDQIVSAVFEVVAGADQPIVEEPRVEEPAIVGRVVAVWGPTGAPGRTTVALGLAVELASIRPVVLIDADPHGGTVAQRLGVLDETSGLLAAARAANTGRWDHSLLGGVLRRAAGIQLLTGLPRGERRVEVRPGVLEAVLDESARIGEVVVDCGFGLEENSEADRMNLDVLARAETIVAVGSADPVGLARLARGLGELADLGIGPLACVVVNRWRARLGWDAAEVRALLDGYAAGVPVRLVPDESRAFDRAHVTGRALSELGGTKAGAALREVASDLVGPLPVAGRRRRRR